MSGLDGPLEVDGAPAPPGVYGLRLTAVTCPSCGQSVPVEMGDITGISGDGLFTEVAAMVEQSCPGADGEHETVRVGAFPDTAPPPTLEQRVALLEEALAHPLTEVAPEWTEEQVGAWRAEFDKAVAGMASPPVLLPPGPRYTPGQVRDFLRECVTVIQPGEWLVLRIAGLTPRQVREYQEMLNQADADGTRWLPFRVLVCPADDMAVASDESVRETLAGLVRTEIRDALALPADDEPLPDVPWLADCDFATWDQGRMTRVTHRPTGAWKDAATRGEAIGLLAAELIRRGKISINDARAAYGLPPFTYVSADAAPGAPGGA